MRYALLMMANLAAFDGMLADGRLLNEFRRTVLSEHKAMERAVHKLIKPLLF